MKKILNLRLTLDVQYQRNGVSEQELACRLTEAVTRIMGEGLLTGDTAAEVVTYDTNVVSPSGDPAEIAGRHVLVAEGGTEPYLIGPFGTSADQLAAAQKAAGKPENGVFWVDVHQDHSLTTGSYTHDELHGEEPEIDEQER